jgi:hypothetical protein
MTAERQAEFIAKWGAKDYQDACAKMHTDWQAREAVRIAEYQRKHSQGETFGAFIYGLMQIGFCVGFVGMLVMLVKFFWNLI